jgi:hypothetical protein
MRGSSIDAALDLSVDLTKLSYRQLDDHGKSIQSPLYLIINKAMKQGVAV